MSNIIPVGAAKVPAIMLNCSITPAGAIGIAVAAVVLADPLGFRDRLFDLAEDLVGARYSFVVNTAEGVYEVTPGIA